MQNNSDSDPWIHKGLAIMFVLIGIAIVVAVITYPDHYGSFPSFGFGGIFSFFLFVFIFFCIFRGVCWGFGWSWWAWGSHNHDGHEKRILKRRYARGDITKEKYESMMKDLDKY
jgi:uncharacterized membrane protein